MSKLKKNLSYHLFYQLLAMILPLVTTPYIARVIGVEGTGIYSYTYAIVQYFMLFILLGINNYGNRTIAKYKKNKEELASNFWNLYAMQMMTFLLVSILYFVYVFYFQQEYYLKKRCQI